MSDVSGAYVFPRVLILIKEVECDVLYLDPPYNERDYGRYYHLPETISKGIIPKPSGKSGIYVQDTPKSRYNNKSAAEAFSELIENATAKCILFHYTDNGLIKSDEIRRILSDKGKIEEYYFDCKGYNNKKNTTKNRHHIYKVKI